MDKTVLEILSLVAGEFLEQRRILDLFIKPPFVVYAAAMLDAKRY